MFWLLCGAEYLNVHILLGRRENGKKGGRVGGSKNEKKGHNNCESVAWTHNYNYPNSVYLVPIWLVPLLLTNFWVSPLLQNITQSLWHESLWHDPSSIVYGHCSCITSSSCNSLWSFPHSWQELSDHSAFGPSVSSIYILSHFST